jgi:BioD-like phosphotransacetylase family protein
MTATQSLKIYEVLNKHFKSPEDAKAVVEQIEQIVEAKVEAKKDVLTTKEDLNNVRLELLNVRNELTEKIHKSKIETIVWIVGVGILQFILTILSKKLL